MEPIKVKAFLGIVFKKKESSLVISLSPGNPLFVHTKIRLSILGENIIQSFCDTDVLLWFV